MNKESLELIQKEYQRVRNIIFEQKELLMEYSKKILEYLKYQIEEKKADFKADFCLEKECVVDKNKEYEITASSLRDYNDFINTDISNWDFDIEFQHLTSAYLRIKISRIKDRENIQMLVNDFLERNNLGVLTHTSVELDINEDYHKNPKSLLALIIELNKKVTMYDIENALNKEKGEERILTK